jgi:Tfp pilus assembly protein PilF
MRLTVGEIGLQLYDAASELAKHGLSELAERTYQIALELNPDDFRSKTNLAVLFDKSGRLDQAEELYLQASSAPFFDPVAMFNLGYLCSRTDRHEQAESWYRKTLITEPNNPEAMVNLASLLVQNAGDVSEAKLLLESALRITPSDSIALQELANVNRLTGETFLAEMLYRRAVEMDEHSALAKFNLALFLEETGASNEASDLFDLAYKLDPEGNLKRGRT